MSSTQLTCPSTHPSFPPCTEVPKHISLYLTQCRHYTCSHMLLLFASNSLLYPQLLEHGRYFVFMYWMNKMNEGILTITLYKADMFLQLVIDKAKILIQSLCFHLKLFGLPSRNWGTEQLNNPTWQHRFGFLFLFLVGDLVADPNTPILGVFPFQVNHTVLNMVKGKINHQLAISTSVFPDNTGVPSLWGTYTPFLKFKAPKGFLNHQQPFKSLLKWKYKLIIISDRSVHASYSEKRQRLLTLASPEGNRDAGI